MRVASIEYCSGVVRPEYATHRNIVQADKKKGLSKCTRQSCKDIWRNIALTKCFETHLQNLQSCCMCFEVGCKNLSTRLCGGEY